MEYKEALSIVVADRYKGKIRHEVHEAMLNWKIEIDN